MAKKERKNRIKVQDLPKNMKVTEDEMKHITGGALSRIGFVDPLIAFDGNGLDDFEDPLVALRRIGFEDPLVAFEDPLVALGGTGGLSR